MSEWHEREVTMVRTLLLVVVGTIAALAAGCPAPVAACEGARCGPPAETTGPRFFAEPPFGIGFDCVTIGCDTEKPLRIENRGDGELALALVRTSVGSSSDFSLRLASGDPLPRPDAQVRLAAGEVLEVLVRYVPSDGTLDEGAIAIEHYDGAIAYEESAPKTDEIPLTARAFGSAAATVQTEVLDFGFVPVGSSATLELVIDNTSADAVLDVSALALEEGASAAFGPVDGDDAAWGERFANPGESARYEVTFTPTVAEAAFGAIILETNDPLHPGIRVALQGTAIAEPRIAIVEPVGNLILPPVVVGETRTRPIVVRNLGGTPLDVTAVLAPTAPAAGLSVSPATITAIAPLATAQIDVTLTSDEGGPVHDRVFLETNDPLAPSDLRVLIDGEVTEPRLISFPDEVEFGNVVQSFLAEPQTVGIFNAGYGELTVTSIGFETGSSSQIQLVGVPQLPVKLSPEDSSISFTVLLNAVNVGPADAVVLIGSDSVDNPIRRVPVHANVITCQQGCPITNGFPSCSSGICEVGSCLPGRHDADQLVGNGCECSEDVAPQGGFDDISAACPGRTLPTARDNEDGVRSFSGTLHTATDGDLLFFKAEDTTEAFDDDYKASVRLLQAPPGLEICVNFQDEGTGCGGVAANCGRGTFNGRSQSTFGGTDSEDVVVFVRWNPDAAPVCGNYTIQYKANEDVNF